MKQSMLAMLMAAYFHEDFPSGDLRGVVDEFIAESTMEQSHALVAEIGALLEQKPSEDFLEKYLDDLGSYVSFAGTDRTYRAWLTEVAEQVAQAVAG